MIVFKSIVKFPPTNLFPFTLSAPEANATVPLCLPVTFSAYQAIELRPPAEKGAQSKVEFTAQQNFGKAASRAGIPQIGAILNGTTGSKSYWDLLPAFWTAVLVNGRDPQIEARKMNEFFVKNIAAGVKDL